MHPTPVAKDAPRPPTPPPAGPAQPARAATPRGVDHCCPARRLEHDPGPGTRGARGVRGGPGAVAGEQAPCPAIAPGRPVSAARRAALSALGLCLLWETPESECPPRPTAPIRLFPLPGPECVPLWRRATRSEDAGPDGSVGPGGLAGRLHVVGPPRAARGGISAPLAAGDAHQPHALAHG
jgi:hypothetical protein